MKAKKIVALFLALVLMCTILAACGGNSMEDKLYKESDPIQVIDGSGRKTSFKSEAKTVATSWGGVINNYIFPLGLSDSLVASNSHGDMSAQYYDVDTMASVGRWTVDKEALADLSPDVFLHGYFNPDLLQAANKVGVRSYGMGFNTLADIRKNLEDLGTIFGVQERAEYIIEYCNNILDLVTSRVSMIPEEDRPTVIVLGEEPGELATDVFDTVEEMIELSGGISCTPDDIKMETETTNVGEENIFKWNPEYIFIESFYCNATIDAIANESAWKAMDAYKNGHIFAIPSQLDGWCFANPSCYLGILFMSMQMYPELYEDIDIAQIAVDFYREIYGLDLDIDAIGLDE